MKSPQQRFKTADHDQLHEMHMNDLLCKITLPSNSASDSESQGMHILYFWGCLAGKLLLLVGLLSSHSVNPENPSVALCHSETLLVFVTLLFLKMLVFVVNFWS